nr:uncharacterized protein LOC104089568 [Nicotiana tomentosiformis]
MAVAKRVFQLGANCGIRLSKSGGIDASKVCSGGLLIDRSQSNGFGSVNFYSSVSSYKSSANKFDYRQISQLAKPNGKRAFLVDTLALVRSLEAQGVPSKQAEAITSAITEVLNDSLENVAHSFVSRAEMQKSEMVQDGNLSKFKSEVQSSQVHNCHEAILVHCSVCRYFKEVFSYVIYLFRYSLCVMLEGYVFFSVCKILTFDKSNLL